MRKMLFVLGKGGVGKTTLSAAISVRLAARSARSLVVSLDPAHNLGDVFAAALADEPRTIAPGVDGIEVDMGLWVERYLTHSREEMRSTYNYLSSLNLDSYMSILKYSPGTEEYAVLWAIEHVQRAYRDVYDLIIFDTPPTALSLRFLAMPSISMLWVNELAKMREAVLEKRQTIVRLNPQASIPKGSFSRSDDRVYAKLDSIRARLASMQRLFCEESYLTVVVNPDDLSLAESVRIRTELSDLKIHINSVSFNKDLDERWYLDRVASTFDGFPVFRSAFNSRGIRSREDLAALPDPDFVEHILCCV